jgi:protein required for attachment to host cells
MTRIKNGDWVMVADGEKALFLVNQTDGEDPFLQVVSEREQVNPPTREQGTDTPGRGHDGGPNHRSAFDETDWHQLAKDRFAHDLADMLYKRAHRGEFDRIVLVAAPGVLGELRDQLHKEVTDRVVGEIPKTLTNHTIEDVEKIVKSDLAEA